MKLLSKQSKMSELKQKAITKFQNTHFRNLTISVLVFSLIFTGVLVFSGNNNNTTAQAASVSEDSVVMTVQTNNLIKAYGLYIDGTFVAAAENKSTIETALDTLLKAKVSSLPITNVTSSKFKNDIRIENGEFNPQYIADASQFAKLLGMEDQYSFTFAVKSITGEAVSCKLSAEVHSAGTKAVEIPFSTNYVDTDLRTAGYQKVIAAGTNGAGTENYENIYNDDKLVESIYISTDVVTKPVDKVIERGVLSTSKTINSLGVLASPYDGKISSGYGPRADGFHEGIDIVAISGSCKGANTYASLSGTVIQACYSSGLGNNVKIDNGNGFVLIYAHLSKILVTKGQTVKVGDVVGQIGATGQASGPHLHFQVEYNGKPVNPLIYLKLN